MKHFQTVNEKYAWTIEMTYTPYLCPAFHFFVGLLSPPIVTHIQLVYKDGIGFVVRRLCEFNIGTSKKHYLVLSKVHSFSLIFLEMSRVVYVRSKTKIALKTKKVKK